MQALVTVADLSGMTAETSACVHFMTAALTAMN